MSALTDAGRGVGIGAALAGTVCGGAIEPVISALPRLRRSLIFAIWLCADLFAASRTRLQTGNFLGEASDGLLNRLILFDAGNVDRRGLGERAGCCCADHSTEGSRDRHRGSEQGVTPMARAQS